MREGRYYAVTDLKEALKLLGDYRERAVILAGGTDLVPRINTYSLKPEVLIYIGKLGLDYVKEENGRCTVRGVSSRYTERRQRPAPSPAPVRSCTETRIG